jgi:hypothetical protein
MKQQSMGRYVALLGHIILIPSQPVFLLINTVCLAEKQQYQFLSLWFYLTDDQTHDLPLSRQAC